jgi:hypothetical protein
VVLAVLVSACGPDTTPHAQCAAAGIRVNVETLPAPWVARGRFTLCQGEVCSTQTSPFTHFYGRGPFLARARDDRAPVVVTLRVEVDGVEVVRARTPAKVQPSPTARAEVSETCGGLITLRLDTEHTKLERQGS